LNHFAERVVVVLLKRHCGDDPLVLDNHCNSHHDEHDNEVAAAVVAFHKMHVHYVAVLSWVLSRIAKPNVRLDPFGVQQQQQK